MTVTITDEQHRQFKDQGFIILNDLFSLADMDEIIGRIEGLERKYTEELVATGGGGISRAQEITFTAHLAEQDPVIAQFTKRQEFVDITTQLLGPDIDLYWDQSVFKKPEGTRQFPWHQDDGYTPVDPSPYLTLWLALNDATPENGCISVLPESHKRGLVKHWQSPIGLVCYDADDPDQGILAPVKAGSMVAFSSLLFHKSGANSSTGTRKAYVVQYSHAGLRNAETRELIEGLMPVARDGAAA